MDKMNSLELDVRAFDFDDGLLRNRVNRRLQLLNVISFANIGDSSRQKIGCL